MKKQKQQRQREVIVFHHNDADGHAAAAVVEKYLREHEQLLVRTFIEMDYMDAVNMDQLRPDQKIIIVDLAWPAEQMVEILNICSDVTWIDHHKTSIDQINKLEDYEFDAVLNTTACAAVLAFVHYFPKAELPTCLKLVNDHDLNGVVERYQYKDKTDLFIHAMKVYNTYPNTGYESFWQKMLMLTDKTTADGAVTGYIKSGELVREAYINMYINASKKYAFEATFEGYNCIVLNTHERRSRVFDFYEKKGKYDIMICFVQVSNEYVISLFTEKEHIDVSAIAAKFGGGGHKQAAGFVYNHLPFRIRQQEGDKTIYEQETFRTAFGIFTTNLKNNEGLWTAYKSNIAEAMQDAYDRFEGTPNIHEISNEAAESFLRQLTDTRVK